MFTGIVEELGVVRDLSVLSDAARLAVAGESLDELSLGESISVNGVCLTVARIDSGGFTADVMNETLRRSSLGALAIGDRVNLERAVTPNTRLGGHIVQGHVDGVGTIAARRPGDHWHEVDVDVPAQLLRYVVEKGSITIDGVSLTVSGLRDSGLTVSLIPETLARTTLGHRGVGAVVNLEVDVIAKYVERLLDSRVQS